MDELSSNSYVNEQIPTKISTNRQFYFEIAHAILSLSEKSVGNKIACRLKSKNPWQTSLSISYPTLHIKENWRASTGKRMRTIHSYVAVRNTNQMNSPERTRT